MKDTLRRIVLRGLQGAALIGVGLVVAYVFVNAFLGAS